jgi:hypothetical protein
MGDLFGPVGPEGNFHHNAVLTHHEDDGTLGAGYVAAGDALVEHSTLPQHLRRHRREFRSLPWRLFDVAADLNKERGRDYTTRRPIPK